MSDEKLMTMDEWRSLSADSRARINAYGKEHQRMQAIITLFGTPTEGSQSAVSDLLAIIHGDGGHYEDEHGTEQAVRDAIEKVNHLRQVLAEHNLLDTKEDLGGTQ